MKKILFFRTVLIGLFFLFTNWSFGDGDEPINLKGLQKNGDDWKIIKQEALSDKHSIKLRQDKWLMYFLHWRPLTKDNEKISIDTVKKLLLNFWGPDMPFTIKGNGGETEVAGHKAYFIDGTIYKGMIRTRFIVWNCPETKRQFIADCNINVRRGTPEKLLELQYDVTSTISCHGGPVVQKHSQLKKKFISEKFNISFLITDDWRTHEFVSEKWFPDGLTNTNGSLWTLLTDSDKYIELMWDDTQTKVSKSLFPQYIKRITGSTYDLEKVTYKIGDLEISQIEEREGYVVGSGSFPIYYTVKDQQGKDHDLQDSYLCRAFLWNNNSKTYFLLTAVISRQEFWGIPTDLSPTEEVMNRHIREEILPHVKVFDKVY